MITIPVDEGFAFDCLAIKRVKADKAPSLAAEEDFNRTKSELIACLSSDLFYTVVGSDEYKRVYSINADVYDAVDGAKTGRISAQEVDYLNWVRWIHKQNLHKRFFDTPYSERKFGYEQWFYLPLTNHHKLVIMDKEDHEFLGHYKPMLWGGYPQCSKGQIHRIIIKRMFPDKQLLRNDLCDHINGNIFDCRRSNLRLATRAQNSQNRFRPITNRTGFKGVSSSGKGYSVEICVNKKRESIGYWLDKKDAARAYNIAAADRCGKFAKLNPVDMSPEDERRIRFDILNKRSTVKTSPYYGVSKRKYGYVAEFRCQNKRHRLGTFDREEDAARAVDKALERLGLPLRNNL